jgi:hypothetical protein
MMGMIHTCTLKHYSEGVDAYGQPGLTLATTSTGLACRFYNKSAQMRVAEESIHLESVLTVSLPSSVTVTKGDTVVSTETGFAGTFRVTNVAPKDGRAVRHHYSCALAIAGGA